MTTFAAFLATPVVERLGWALVHFVWLGAAVAALFAAVQALLRNRSANSRYAAACAALVIMAILPVATFFFVPASKSARASKEPAVAEAVLENSEAQAPTPEPTETASRPAGSSRENRFGVPPSGGKNRLGVPPSGEKKPTKVGTPNVSSVFGERTAPTANILREETGGSSKPGPAPYAARIRDAFARLEPLLPRLVFIWLIGVVLLSLRLLGGWVQVGRLKRRWAVPAAERWQQMLLDVARRLRLARPVRLLESAAARVPTVIGWLRPVILLPASILTGLAPEQIEALLAHELAHIRRHDYLVNLVQSVVETLLFYHPAVWWISRRIRIEREHCCDDLAVATCGDAVVYARALADLESLRFAAPQPVLAATGGPLLSRIRRILAPPAQRPGCSPRWLAGAIVLGAIITVATVIHLSALADSRSAPVQSAMANDDNRTSTTSPGPAPMMLATDRSTTSTIATSPTLEIRVVSARTSEPLAGVTLYIDAERRGARLKGKAETDINGRHVLELPLRLKAGNVYISARKDGFSAVRAAVVPRAIRTKDGKFAGKYEDLPPRVEIALEPGRAIGGLVEDPSGMPLSSATVYITIPPAGHVSFGRLADDEFVTTTGAEGRWQCNCAPSYLFRTKIVFDHYDYGAHARLLGQTDALYNLTHRHRMEAGHVLKGRVLDLEGRPVSGASVGISHEKINTAKERTQTDNQGRFRFDMQRESWPPQCVVVQAPGYAPAQVAPMRSDISPFSLLYERRDTASGFPRRATLPQPPLEFRLSPGHRIEGRVVDSQGHPIAGVQVQTVGWRDCWLPGWTTYTDAEGRFVWDGAPTDAVKFSFSAKDWTHLYNHPLASSATEHVITLIHQCRITGTVVDASTSTPIPKFRVTWGQRTADESAKDFSWMRYSTRPFTDGRYEIALPHSENRRYRVRVDADGYPPTQSPEFDYDEQGKVLDFALRKHDRIQGIVRNNNGEPLAAAVVLLGTPTRRRWVGNGQFQGSPDEYTTETRSDGRFLLPPVNEPFSIAVLHDQGYGQVTDDEFKVTSTVVVSPWGRIEGRRLIGTNPYRLDMDLIWPDPRSESALPARHKGDEYYVSLSNASVLVQVFGPPSGSRYLRWEAVGHFTVDRLLPGTCWFSRPDSQAYIPVEVKAGETTRLQIGGMGRAVVGRIIVPPGRESEFSFGTASSDMYLIKPHVPVPEETRKQGPDAVRAWEQNWLRSDEGKKYIQATAGYTITLKPDGSFTIADVVSGTYHLRITTKGGAVEHDFTMPDIPGGRSDEPLDLGRLELKTSGWEPGAK